MRLRAANLLNIATGLAVVGWPFAVWLALSYPHLAVLLPLLALCFVLRLAALRGKTGALSRAGQALAGVGWREGDLSPAAVRYTRRVTQVWCGFFIVNGGVSLWTCLHGNVHLWTLWNGMLSYVLMAALFAGEWVVRQRVKRHHG